MAAGLNKRVFDTDNALHATFNRYWGKWQILTYIGFALSYALIIGWLDNLYDYTMLVPSHIKCNYTDYLETVNYTNRTTIQRLSGRSKYIIQSQENNTVEFKFDYNISEYGKSVATDFDILCDIVSYIKASKFSHYIGFIIGSIMLGIASDKGGRKSIILACIWTSGIMSLFQMVGHDYVSFVFFQFFLGIFVGGVQASFLPAIIEMFPINFRTFYGVAFHLVVSLFATILPWLAKSFKSWKALQTFVTAPILLTACLHFFVYESIFWYLAHKEYDKVIGLLTRLAKRNGISFSSKFPQADEFKNAKHSKATQVDILPLLRLQDVELLGKKYPQVDMVDLQKQKANSSKVRRILNSFKGASYRSTNTIYRPFDFVYSPTLFVYVIILCGLWFTNGLTDSMEISSIKDTIKHSDNFNLDFYLEKCLFSLTILISSILAILVAIFKFGRKIQIFSAYLVIEVCLLGSLIAEYNPNEEDIETNIALMVLYQVCKFSAHFGYIFLLLITAELLPTSLRCSGVGLCFAFKCLGSLIAHPDLLNYNSINYRLFYCILTLFFGSVTLFLPETRTFPLPRSILQIEAMPTTIGKRLRSRKVQLACERRQNQYAFGNVSDYPINKQNLININDPHYTNLQTLEEAKEGAYHLVPQNSTSKLMQTIDSAKSKTSTDEFLLKDGNNTYDTVSSFNDIEQDDHKYYNKESMIQTTKYLLKFDRSNRLGKIHENPSNKNNKS